MAKSKILVTGGTGYIGSHTVVKLIEAGYDVLIIDNLCNSTKTALEGIRAITGCSPEFHELDVRDKSNFQKLIDLEGGFDGVIHFAALKAVGESQEKPLAYYDNNVNGFIQLLNNCKQHQINNVIFSSSATVYGIPDTLPITESHELKPALSPYGNTKKICEEILIDAVRSVDKMKGIALRYFNPIGAHPSGEIGEMPQGIPNNLMPFITQTAAGIRKELLIFGDDYDTPDGTAIRDYIHVEDLAEAHAKAVSYMLRDDSDADFEIFNLGTGTGYTVKQVIAAFEKSTGVKVPHRIVGRRTGDAPEIYTATVLANEKLDWKATRTLEDMTSSSWNWESKYRKKNSIK